MGLGPSIKMTSLYHYNCPTTKVLSEDKDIVFDGIIIDGVSENCDDKLRTARLTALLAKERGWQGALVAIDGWGNHHVDFVDVIDELGKRDIPSVGLSYIGLQGRLVCDSPYVNTIIDFNKNESGYESCIVGDNTLEEIDAIKATALLKLSLKKSNIHKQNFPRETTENLIRESIYIDNVVFSDKTQITGSELHISDKWINYHTFSSRIEDSHTSIIKPKQHNIRVNSNLDFLPIATKTQGFLGQGTTTELTGVTFMLNGCEASGFQPSNIGSSEGYLNKQVVFDKPGTPGNSDFIIHMDIKFRDGEGRTASGLIEAHLLADYLMNEVRAAIRNESLSMKKKMNIYNYSPTCGYKIGLVKIVSGLGNMYDTILCPNEPSGVLGGYLIRNRNNNPVYITANECRDGFIHSLL